MRVWFFGMGDRELVEVLGRDKVWGIGFVVIIEDEVRVVMEYCEYWGENCFGKVLMVVRVRI